MVTKINNVAKNAEISIYPNPVQGKLFIKSATDNKILGAEIYDVLGRKIKSNVLNLKSNEMQSIDVSDLKEGMYILNLNENEHRYSRNFMVK